jgi:hypothetical protein
LKTCEIKIKQSLAKQDNDFKELNKFKLQRGDQPYRLQTPRGCVNWRDLSNDRLLFGFIVFNDSLPGRHGVHRFRLFVDEIFVHDTRMYPITPSIHCDSVLEAVKSDLNLLGITLDTRKTCSLIDTNCFDFSSILVNDLKRSEDSMLTLLCKTTNSGSIPNSLYDQLLHQLQLQIRRFIKLEPNHSFRFLNDIYKLYLVYMVDLRWLQYFFLRVFTDTSFFMHGKYGYADLDGFDLVDSLRHEFKLKVDALIQLNHAVAAHESEVRKKRNMEASEGNADAIALKERNRLLTKERMRRLRERNRVLK